MQVMPPSAAQSRGTAPRVPGPRPQAVVLLAILAIVACVAGSPRAASSQVVGQEMVPGRLALFLDCNFCNESFIRQEMTYVDYVRDREVASVHVLVTQQEAGAGGEARPST